MLRGTVGITAAVQAWLFIVSADPSLVAAAPAVVLIVCGIALTAGIFTSACTTVVGVGYALVLITPLRGVALPRLDYTTAIVGVATAIGLGLLGPGAFSIDARLFGRREIFIPATDAADEPEQP